MRHGSNLFRRKAMYYARQAIPQDLQGHICNDVGKPMRELRRSLGTTDKAQARRLLPPVLQDWQRIFDDHRVRLASRDAMSVSSVPADIEAKLLRQLYEDVLRADDRERQARATSDENLERLRQVAARFRLPEATLSRLSVAVLAGKHGNLVEELREIDVSMPDSERDALLDEVIDVYLAEDFAGISAAANDSVVEDLRSALGRGDTALATDIAAALLARAACPLVVGTPAFIAFAHKVQRVLLEAWERRCERDRGDFRGVERDPVLVRPPAGARLSPEPTARQEERIRSLAELFAMYERENRNGLKAHSLTQARQSVQLLAGYVGETRKAHEIGKAEIAEWIDHLRDFPTRASQITSFRGMRFREIVEANRAEHRPVLTVKTIRRMVSEVSGFFGWMENRGYVPTNPVRGQTPRLDKSNSRRRRPFREHELVQLFSSPLYAGCENAGARHEPGTLVQRDAHYWMPLLALLTGARMGELAQLHVSDIGRSNDVWFVNITDLHAETGQVVADKSLKTRSSKRMVPLHKVLVEWGFLDYVHAQAAHDARLFPSLVRNVRGEFSDYSREFGRYLVKIGLKSDKTLTFHSFRHTFMDALRRGGIKKYERELLAGHARHDMNDLYGEEVDGTVEERANWIERMDFGELDLSTLLGKGVLLSPT